MGYDGIIARVAEGMGLPKVLVDRVYKSYWRAVREHIEALPLKEDLSDEEFLKLQPNVNIPSLGKLHVTLDRYRRKKKSFDMYYKNYKDKKQKEDNNAKD